jgi:HEAT repeat protein
MRTAHIAVLLGSLTSVALAESHDASTITLGYLTEHSDAVAVLTAGAESAPGQVIFTVGSVLRGRIDGATVEIARSADEPQYPVGQRYLAFLTRVVTDDGAYWRPATRTFGMRELPEKGPETRFPEIVGRIAGTLGEGNEVREPDRLRSILVSLMDDADPGIAWSGALDFVRHHELHEGLSEAERATILAAYRRQPIGKATKGALAYAVAATRDPAAGTVLLDSMAAKGASRIRTAVGEALRRLADPAVPAELSKRIDKAEGEGRADLLIVLGGMETPEGVESAARHLDDETRVVRLAAAHTLGLSARALHAGKPAAEVPGLDKLRLWLENVRSENEIRACLWAIAQLDRPEAYDVLRNALTDPREDVRRFASQYLKQPRQSLLLR